MCSSLLFASASYYLLTLDLKPFLYEILAIEYNQCETNTPGPHLMRIHLVQYSTSVRPGKNPQVFIILVQNSFNANFVKFQKLHYTMTLVRT